MAFKLTIPAECWGYMPRLEGDEKSVFHLLDNARTAAKEGKDAFYVIVPRTLPVSEPSNCGTFQLRIAEP